MQPSAAPDLADLAHTHARPAHWLAVATVTAAVVALAGLLQPDSAGAGGPGASAAAPEPAPAPEAAGVTYPLECRGAPHTVARQVTGDLDGDGNPETVAVVHCEAGSGTPPSGVYVLTRGERAGAPARVVATLVAPELHKSVAGLAVRDGAVRATLLGYSSLDVPSCCPDEKEQVSWRWRGGAFVRSGEAGARGA